MICPSSSEEDSDLENVEEVSNLSFELKKNVISTGKNDSVISNKHSVSCFGSLIYYSLMVMPYQQKWSK